MELGFFDCDICVGARNIAYPESYDAGAPDIGWLAAAMERYGITKALAYHSMAREYNATIGNTMLPDALRGMDNLLPVWVVMPHHTGEFCSPQELTEKMKTCGVKAARMFPAEQDHRYGINERNCGALFAALENCGIPVLIGIDQLTWDELCSICEHHHALKIILCNLDYSINRNLYPILSQYENIFLETFGYKVQNGIEEICHKFGAGRLVFGSGMPRCSGAAAVSMISYARISDDEKKMIAHGNLENLIGMVYT